jgi:hypothetical protein
LVTKVKPNINSVEASYKVHQVDGGVLVGAGSLAITLLLLFRRGIRN